MPHLEHLGIAVRDAESVAELLQALLGEPPYKQETVAREGVRTHFIAAGTAKLELLEALGPDSPVARFLEKRGEGLHHLAFEVDDVEAQLARARALGLTPLSDTPRPGADGKRIFFLHPKQTHGILLEFCQTAPASLADTAPDPEVGQTTYRFGAPSNPPALLAGGPDDAELLLPLARQLEMAFHTHALVLDAIRPPGEMLADALDHLGRPAAVIGVGSAAAPALRTAARHPDRIARLVLYAFPEDGFPEDLASLTALHTRALVCAPDDEPALLHTALRLHTSLPHARLAILPTREGALAPSLLGAAMVEHLRAEAGR